MGSYVISGNLDGVRNHAIVYATALVVLMVILASLWNKLPDRPTKTG
jgi:hypothetical protein